MADPPADRRAASVPPLLQNAAGWAWRLLVLALAAYLLVRLADLMYLLVLPMIAGLLGAALFRPVVLFFRRRGLGRGLSTWTTLLLAAAVLGGLGFLVVREAINQYPTLVVQLNRAVRDFAHFLTHGPLHLSQATINRYENDVTHALSSHQKVIVSGVITGLGILGQVVTGAVIAFFVMFFLLYDGDRIWAWLRNLFPPSAHEDVHLAARRAWQRLSGYVHGTFLVAVFHGVVVSVTLAALGVPLVAPVGVLVFFGSFIPIVGVLVFGGLAVIIALLTKGIVGGVVMLVVLLLENQIEAHLLQPFLVGRFLRLHPLAVILVIAGGGLLEGIPGAILALPVTAVLYALGDYYVELHRTRQLLTTGVADPAALPSREPLLVAGGSRPSSVRDLAARLRPPAGRPGDRRSD